MCAAFVLRRAPCCETHVFATVALDTLIVCGKPGSSLINLNRTRDEDEDEEEDEDDDESSVSDDDGGTEADGALRRRRRGPGAAERVPWSERRPE